MVKIRDLNGFPKKKNKERTENFDVDRVRFIHIDGYNQAIDDIGDLDILNSNAMLKKE